MIIKTEHAIQYFGKQAQEFISLKENQMYFMKDSLYKECVTTKDKAKGIIIGFEDNIRWSDYYFIVFIPSQNKVVYELAMDGEFRDSIQIKKSMFTLKQTNAWEYKGENYASFKFDWDIVCKQGNNLTEIVQSIYHGKIATDGIDVVVYVPKWNKCYKLLNYGVFGRGNQLKCCLEDIYTKQTIYVMARDVNIVVKIEEPLYKEYPKVIYVESELDCDRRDGFYTDFYGKGNNDVKYVREDIFKQFTDGFVDTLINKIRERTKLTEDFKCKDIIVTFEN